MTDKPILFSPSMVRALLDGRKTMTRRVLANVPARTPEHDRQWHTNVLAPGGSCPEHWTWWEGPPHGQSLYHQEKLKFAPGDRLYVREAWRTLDLGEHMSPSAIVANYRSEGRDHRKRIVARYEADAVERGIREGDQERFAEWGRYRQGMHMPRCLSRLTLIVTGVRVERLQDISEADAVAEGVEYDSDGWFDYLMPSTQRCVTARGSFQTLWESINAKRGFGWDANPWVSVTAFDVIKGNIDQVKA